MKKQRGLAILETIVAFGLVALVFFAVMEVVPSALFLVRGQERQQTAERWAQSLLEEQSGRPWGELTVGSARDLDPREQAGVTYRAHLAVLAAPGYPAELVRRVRVQVSWEYRGRPQELARELVVHHLRQP